MIRWLVLAKDARQDIFFSWLYLSTFDKLVIGVSLLLRSHWRVLLPSRITSMTTKTFMPNYVLMMTFSYCVCDDMIASFGAQPCQRVRVRVQVPWVSSFCRPTGTSSCVVVSHHRLFVRCTSMLEKWFIFDPLVPILCVAWATLFMTTYVDRAHHECHLCA